MKDFLWEAKTVEMYATPMLDYLSEILLFQIIMISTWFPKNLESDAQSPFILFVSSPTPILRKAFCKNFCTISASITPIGLAPSRSLPLCSMPRNSPDSHQKFLTKGTLKETYAIDSTSFDDLWKIVKI